MTPDGEGVSAVRPVPWWHRLHTWTLWEWKGRDVNPLMGQSYRQEWQERSCVRCGLTERKF